MSPGIETSLETQWRGIAVAPVDRPGSRVGEAGRTTVLVRGIDAGAWGAVGGVTDRGGCGGGLIGLGGADCQDRGVTPVCVAGGAGTAFAGGLTLFVNILDGGAGHAGGGMTRRTWESIGPDGGIIAR